MFFSKWLRWRQDKHQSVFRKSRRRPLALELLESRVVPTSFTWTGGGANSNWSTGGNWQGGVAPTTTTALAGMLIFGTGEARLTNTDDISGLSVAEVQVAGGYSFSGYGLTLTGASGVGIDNQSGTNTVNNALTMGFNMTFQEEAGSLILTAAISGDFNLTQNGSGTLVLTGGNNYSGTTTISAGTLQIGNGGANYGLGVGSVVDNGNLTFDLTGTQYTNDSISGSGSLTQAGLGTTVLTAPNTYTGTTTISAGILQLGNGYSGTLGSGTVIDDASLAFGRNDNSFIVPNAISGTGSVQQIGGGTTALTGANTYSGTTTLTSGFLQIGNGSTTGTLGSGSVTDNAALSFDRSDTGFTVSNAISGSGGITQSGFGTTSLTGDNTNYDGTVTISAGTLQIGNGGTSGNLGSASVTDDATLAFNFNDNFTFGGSISGTGAVKQVGSGTTSLTSSSNSYGGLTTISAAPFRSATAVSTAAWAAALLQTTAS